MTAKMYMVIAVAAFMLYQTTVVLLSTGVL